MRPLDRSGPDFQDLLRRLPEISADDVPRLLDLACQGWHRLHSATAYLTDYPESVLIPLAAPTVGLVTVPVEGTAAGRAFRQQEPVPDDDVLWLPMTNRWRRIGVLRTQWEPGADGVAVDAGAVELATLVAGLLDSAARCTDTLHTVRRREPISLTAEIQWELLPPLCIAGRGATLAGRLEPAYQVGGDSFDFAIDSRKAHVGIFDPLGHDLKAALLASLAVGTYRNARRSGVQLSRIGPTIDAAVVDQFEDRGFVTGQLGELDLGSGDFAWVNAGHPLPLLLRAGQVSAVTLSPDPPWGMGHRHSNVGHLRLVPGDRLLFFTDGVVEARSSHGEGFGYGRLTALLADRSREAGSPAELLRLVLTAVMAHRDAPLADDATAVLLVWQGTAAEPELGG